MSNFEGILLIEAALMSNFERILLIEAALMGNLAVSLETNRRKNNDRQILIGITATCHKGKSEKWYYKPTQKEVDIL